MEKDKQMHKLADTLICNIEQVARLGRRSAVQFFDKNENILVSFNDFLILETLFDNPDIHQRNLAKILVRGTANLSRDLDKLEKREIIRRTVSVKNNRTVKTLKLTEQGENIYLDICQKCIEHVKNLEDIFSKDDLKTFMNLIQKYKARLIETCGEILE